MVKKKPMPSSMQVVSSPCDVTVISFNKRICHLISKSKCVPPKRSPKKLAEKVKPQICVVQREKS